METSNIKVDSTSANHTIEKPADLAAMELQRRIQSILNQSKDPLPKRIKRKTLESFDDISWYIDDILWRIDKAVFYKVLPKIEQWCSKRKKPKS